MIDCDYMVAESPDATMIGEPADAMPRWSGNQRVHTEAARS